MIRRLWLQNENGQVYSFSDQTECIAASLQNFGVETNLTYFEYETSYQPATTKMAMTKPSMVLHLMKGYEGYSKLVAFLYQSNELKLYYESDDLKYIYVDVASLTKQELSGPNYLQTTITFNKKSLWMKEYNVTINEETVNNTKVYDYTYDYVYADVVGNEISITNRGSVPAPINIQITGQLENPLIQVFSNDQIVSQCKVNVNTENGVLLIRSEEGHEAMELTENDVTRNVYQEQDFTMDGFIYAPVGSSTIKITPGSGAKYIYNLTFHELYRGN